jgi:predicted dehydrogenase
VRIGFVGAGAIAEFHLAILVEQPGIEITAVCDVDDGRRRRAADWTGARTFSDWRELVSGDVVDALFVCTPPLHHAEPAIAALQRGLPVYLEKPLARTLADGEAIAAAWRQSGSVCAIGYQWRSLDLLAELRSLLRGAQPGMLVSRSYGATEAARHDLDDGSWFTDPRASGGILFELASHDIDLQIALAGPVEWVHAHAQSGLLALSGLPGSELDDAVTVLLGFAAGGLGAVNVAWSIAGLATYALDVHAAGVSVNVALEPRREIRGRAHGSEVVFDGASGARHSSVRRFLESVRSGDPASVACSPEDALATLRAVLACERAIATGERVAVGP